MKDTLHAVRTTISGSHRTVPIAKKPSDMTACSIVISRAATLVVAVFIRFSQSVYAMSNPKMIHTYGSEISSFVRFGVKSS